MGFDEASLCVLSYNSAHDKWKKEAWHRVFVNEHWMQKEIFEGTFSHPPPLLLLLSLPVVTLLTKHSSVILVIAVKVLKILCIFHSYQLWFFCYEEKVFWVISLQRYIQRWWFINLWCATTSLHLNPAISHKYPWCSEVKNRLQSFSSYFLKKSYKNGILFILGIIANAILLQPIPFDLKSNKIEIVLHFFKVCIENGLAAEVEKMHFKLGQFLKSWFYA